MENRILDINDLTNFRYYLFQDEKSPLTVEKYLRDAKAFYEFAAGRTVTKELTISFKQDLQRRNYTVCSVNSMLASVNRLLVSLGWDECRVKSLRSQRQTYCANDRELTKTEYFRLLEAASCQPKLKLILQTICGTGIRVSELQFFTVEAVQHGEVSVQCKSKIRRILIPGKLKKIILHYAKEQGIRSGPVFISRNGKVLDRSNIWAQMKRLCSIAGVNPSKVFPHNLRKLFARIFYTMEKDIAKLADILGHSSIETTRIYIMTTGIEHRRKIERMGLII